ncbi:MAG: 16S rRNA (cytidine(1402)-2'-O)-methyltransferase [Actinomycetota bacterium]|nr:16S rRNA (cytidine(1402)-2'-O)-methyltransferase [Actinomycetota bacterium]
MAKAAVPDPGTLFVVPTPIGNLRDITLRAIDVLRSAEVVAAEDTRKARALLRALDIKANLVSYYDFNENSRSLQLVRMLATGKDVALIADAGTPLVNDPGYRVVTAAIAAGVRVCPLPGPSAPLTALVGSGLPVQRFEYAGFLPRKPAARRAAAAELADVPATLIFFEAPHRLRETLADLRDVLGDRNAALACNLTKANEEYVRGPLSQIAGEFEAGREVGGEYTLLVAGAQQRDTSASEALADRIAQALFAHGVVPHTVRDVVRQVSGLPRNRVYERVEMAQRAARAPDAAGAGPPTEMLAAPEPDEG